VSGPSKGNSISSGARKNVYQDLPLWGRSARYLLCDLCSHWFWSNTKPGIVSQPDAVVPFGKEIIALGPVVLNVPRHLATVLIMMDLRRRFFVTGHGGSIVVKTWVK
jgi:hypothetical protein